MVVLTCGDVIFDREGIRRSSTDRCCATSLDNRSKIRIGEYGKPYSKRGKPVAFVVAIDQFEVGSADARSRKFLEASAEVRERGGARFESRVAVDARRLLDGHEIVHTNILSELPRPRPNAKVVSWFAEQETSHMSVVTL